MKKVQDNLSMLNKAERQVEASPGLTPQQKRNALDQINAYKGNLTRGTLQVIAQIKQKESGR